MAKTNKIQSKKKVIKASPKKSSGKKTASRKTSSASNEKLYSHWGLVSMNKEEAYIHLAFDSPIKKANLKKWSEGYLASLLQAKAMVLNESIFNDWEIEKVEFKREDPNWREQDFPFWVGKQETDGIYKEILKLNSKL